MKAKLVGAASALLVLSCGGAPEALKPHGPGWLLQGSGTSGKELFPLFGGNGDRTEDSVAVAVTSDCVACGPWADVRGSIVSPDGQAQIHAGWVVAAIERASNVARVGEVDGAGLYKLGHVETDEPQTLALFSPDYILQAVLSIPSPAPNTIRQFVEIRANQLPRLINKGQIISFSDLTGLSPTRDLASDVNGDGVPDGMVSIPSDRGRSADFAASDLNAKQDSSMDLDVDGIVNELDPDIDGDGVINSLDPDDNGNGILDAFDPDANGDYQPDSAPGQEDTDGWFPKGLRYAATTLRFDPREGGGFDASLTFRAALRADVEPLAAQIRGAPALLNNSYVLHTDETGQTFPTAFNRVLDREADGTYLTKVQLEDGRLPRAHEALFYQLAFGPRENPWFMEFPVVFPPIRPQPVTMQFDANTRTALLVGNPFGEYQHFSWAVNLVDDGGRVQYMGPMVAGDRRQFQIPTGAVGTRVYALAMTQGKVLGQPAVVVTTRQYPVTDGTP